MDRAGAGIYPDLLSTFGVDLVEALRVGSPSPGALLVLISALPMGSMTQAWLVGDRGLHGFSREVAVSADVYDAVMTNMVGSAMGKFKKLPDPYPRPGKGANKGSQTISGAKSVRELASMMGAL